MLYIIPCWPRAPLKNRLCHTRSMTKAVCERRTIFETCLPPWLPSGRVLQRLARLRCICHVPVKPVFSLPICSLTGFRFNRFPVSRKLIISMLFCYIITQKNYMIVPSGLFLCRSTEKSVITYLIRIYCYICSVFKKNVKKIFRFSLNTLSTACAKLEKVASLHS